MKRTTKFKDSQLELVGDEIKIGSKAPDFKLTANDMSDLTQSILFGKITVILAVPSLDTPTCSLETKKFNTEVAGLSPLLQILAVSRDLPFAQKRWCGAEGVDKVTTVSDYKYREFGTKFGALIKDWDLLSRAVFVIDDSSIVKYVEYVPEVSSEPNYGKVFEAVKELI